MTDLLARTAELVAIPSLSQAERALADLVERELAAAGGVEVVRIGDNVIARTDLGRDQRIVLAGHLDTVPANGNERPVIDGDTLWGLGAADMKAGIAVMLELAGALARGAAAGVDLTWVFYSAEEIAREYSGLLVIDATRPDLLEGDLAILLEPTGAVIEAGCQGVLKADVTLRGARAHVARPWTGRNAIHRIGPVLAALGGWPGREPVVDGCRYREALNAVAIRGGVAANVIPDEVVLSINYRFAPDRDVAGATAALRAFIDPFLEEGDALAVIDSAPAAAPGLSHPLVGRLRAATGAAARAKLGWTDVAFFAERAVPAVNFGPGDPEVAHRADEHVSRGDLDAVYAALAALLFDR
jgi:succinyl-diaminopimelate desuccinylase